MSNMRWDVAVCAKQCVLLQAAQVCQHCVHCRGGRNVSSAAHSQAAISESNHNRSGSTKSVSSALTCQLSCNVKSALQTVIWLRLVSWAAVWQLGCHIPSQLKVSAEVHTFQPCCSFTVCLQSFAEVAVSQHCCTVSPPLQLCLNYVSPFAVCQLSSGKAHPQLPR